MDIEKAIREYLPNVIHMSLSTSRDDKPWTCEVHYAYDEMLSHIYFFSRKSTRHCEDITMNPFVSGSIVRQHEASDKPRGVYFEGSANLLSNVTENDPAYQVYSGRFNGGPELFEEAAKSDGHQFYEITVSDWYMFDAVESSPSQKYHLSVADIHKT